MSRKMVYVWAVVLLAAVGCIGFAGGVIVGKKGAEKKNAILEASSLRPLFTPMICRQSVDFLSGRIGLAKTPAERNLYAIAASTLREAELFSVFDEFLQTQPPAARPAAIAAELEWEKFYKEMMFRPLQFEGREAAAMESALRSSSMLLDRILYLSSSQEVRKSYDALKNMTFLDRFVEPPCPVTLQYGMAFILGREYQIVPGLTAGDADAGTALVFGPTGRQLIVWEKGGMSKSVKMPDVMEITRVRINPLSRKVEADYMLKGKSGTLPFVVNF